jgi:hypothetical protein
VHLGGWGLSLHPQHFLETHNSHHLPGLYVTAVSKGAPIIPISNLSSGCIKHLTCRWCANVEMPENPNCQPTFVSSLPTERANRQKKPPPHMPRTSNPHICRNSSLSPSPPCADQKTPSSSWRSYRICADTEGAKNVRREMAEIQYIGGLITITCSVYNSGLSALYPDEWRCGDVFY